MTAQLPPSGRLPSGILTGPLSERSKALMQEYLATIPVRDENDNSDIFLGEGRFRYRLVNDWAKLPAGWTFDDVGSVAVDAKDRVFVFNRGEHPMMVFDREGNLIDHWGEGIFVRAHGVHIGPDGMLYCTDDGDHTVKKCSPDGKVVLTLGVPNRPAPIMSGDPFCRCTDVALSPDGEIYVSDGYYNARVHKYSPDGKLIMSWGGPGIGPGEFNIAHNICTDPEGWVYVADRENHRIQVFDGNGKYETEWHHVHRASSLEQEKTAEGLFYCGEIGPHLNCNRFMPNLGPRVTILSKEGKVLARIGTLPAGNAADRFISPHGIAIDSRGDVYVGEVSLSSWNRAFPGQEVPENLRTLRKLVKVA